MIARSTVPVTAALTAGIPGAAPGEAVRVENAPFTATFLVKRKTGMSHDAFRAYQLDTHVPLALALPGLQTYRLSFLPPLDGTDQAADALVEVTFASADAYESAMASEEGQRALADLPNMLDMESMTILTGVEHYVGGLDE